jgi:regulator of sigma E protease
MPTGNVLLTILEFIIALGLLAFFHELGHFLIAKLFKIEILEFGFGFPPRILKLFKIRETQFSLNAIPFGAFVLPKGENDPTIEGGMAAAKPGVRLAVLLGGPLMNLLIGAILFAFVFMRTGLPDTTKVEIIEVAADSPAAAAGILPGDLVTAINGQTIDSMTTLSAIVRENLGTEVEIALLRGEQALTVRATPRENPPEGQGALGIIMGNPIRPAASFLQALPLAGQQMLNLSRELLTLPVRLIQGAVPRDQARFVSPIGIYSIFQQVRDADAEQTAANPENANVTTFYFLGTLSIALGVTNLLPIPALDGGRIILLLPELLFRRRINPKYENMVNLLGFTALLALMFILAINDIVNPVVLP